MAIITGLDNVQDLVNGQAVAKGWKTEALFCIKRAQEELEELKNSVLTETPMKIALESIDVIYFVVQVSKDKAPMISLDKAFELKYEDNWKNKKKTEDENGNVIKK